MPIDLPEFQKEHCFKDTLYFVYDGGALITTQYGEFWTDTFLPDDGLIDVSEYFPSMVGSTLKRFRYDNNSIVKGWRRYSQPITILEMDSGQKINFSINFGEVDAKDRAAYFELL